MGTHDIRRIQSNPRFAPNDDCRRRREAPNSAAVHLHSNLRAVLAVVVMSGG